MHRLKNFSVSFQYSDKQTIETEDAKSSTWSRINCRIIDNDTNEVFGEGVATCSKKDIPCKNTGRKLALERALQNGAFDKYQRRSIFDELFQRGVISKK